MKKGVNFANWFLSLPMDTKYFFTCSDEAYFYLTLPINKQNNRNWCESPPYEGIEIHLHDGKVLVWCAIFGAYFFEEPVNQTNYLKLIKTY